MLRQLALHAIDAAKSAGAAYADVRLTRIVRQRLTVPVPIPSDEEALAVGVRCLVDGTWGFTSSPVWTTDEVTQLARRAAETAKAHRLPHRRPAELVSAPVANGIWTTPVAVDPFTVPLEEKQDFLLALRDAVSDASGVRARLVGGISCVRDERVVATSEGTYVAQTLFRTVANLALAYPAPERAGAGLSDGLRLPVRQLAPAGRGWELVHDARILEQLPGLVAEAEEVLAAPVRPAELGRVDVVFDAPSMAVLVAQTLGVATELDRALGYEANTVGTSYLGPDVLSLLGTAVGAPLVTVQADRTLPGGIATVQWDDEGVTPETATLVQAGRLHDYQTTREQAASLASYYQQHGRPVRSHGYAGADSALRTPLQHRPNLTLASGSEALTRADLIAQTARGIAVVGGDVVMDIQAKTGEITGLYLREVVRGKLGARITGGVLRVTTPELWHNIVAVGGTASIEVCDQLGPPVGRTTQEPPARMTQPRQDVKGEPRQALAYSVQAVPAVARQLTLVTPARDG